MPKPAGSSTRLCGQQSPYYTAHDMGGKRVADLCTRPVGHRSAHNWWGYVDNHNRATT